MKYPPPHHQDPDKTHMLEVIRHYPLATIISVKDQEPLTTHLPLVYREDGKLIGHIDIYNPQAQLLKGDNPITIIFYGPQCYISPTVYTTTQLPTWNYIRVHLKGTVKEIQSKEALKESLIKMTEFLEAPDHKYVLYVRYHSQYRSACRILCSIPLYLFWQQVPVPPETLKNPDRPSSGNLFVPVW